MTGPSKRALKTRIRRLQDQVGVEEAALAMLDGKGGGDAGPWVGIGQIAEMMGIVKANVRRDLIAPGHIPEPDYELPSGPIWLRSRIELAKAERELRLAEV